MPWLVAGLIVVSAYLIGAIPFGYLVARMRGVDIFAHGSGNICATNVGRVLGQRYGVLVFLLDCAKGAAPVMLAWLLKTHYRDDLWLRGWVEVAAGLAAFLGHLFPIYLGFRGGKGVATGLGVVAVLLPIPGLVALAVWTVVLCGSRIMAVASISAVIALCAVHLRQPAAWDWREPLTWFSVIAGLLVIVKHHANIARLVRGTENKLEDTGVMRQLTKSLHVLALGLWFGSAVFFTFVVAQGLFGSFEAVAQQPMRETWFPQGDLYRDATDAINAPKEQGTRAAGHAIGPMFVWYFALQGACGFIALATAFPWVNQPGGSRVHQWRLYVLLAAVLFVLIGWPLERHVSALRVPRNESTEAFLRAVANPNANAATIAERKTEMEQARGEFVKWHLVSILLNVATILCVTVAMAMAGNLESAQPQPEPEPKKEDPKVVDTSGDTLLLNPKEMGSNETAIKP